MKAKSNSEAVKNKTMMKDERLNFWLKAALCACLLLTLSFVSANAQEQPPKPGAPRVAKIPSVVEKKLANGLKVATVEHKNVPLVTVELLVTNGANVEGDELAGLANLTASMLTKGTKTKTASQIASAVEFLGGSINAGAGWNSSLVQITVTNDKLDAAMAILADVVLNPAFKKDELDLLKSQTLDGLAYNLRQPGFLANYVASKYAFEEHPAGGTPETIAKITVDDVARFKTANYTPDNSVLIFTGDITSVRANTLGQKFFGKWRNSKIIEKTAVMEGLVNAPIESSQKNQSNEIPILNRILVVDLPNSGQASVNYTKLIDEGRVENPTTNPNKAESSRVFYPALVMNSVLGGGYSSRLNQEIRIKRGLSYGAGSNFAWRWDSSNFSTSTQTKNESAAEVAELVLSEIKRLREANVPANELAPRKLVLTGDFGRELESTASLAQLVASLYTYDLPTNELNSHIKNINAVSDAAIKSFAADYLKNGNLVIVGDYSVFKEDLAKRFPNMKIEVVKADDLDLSANNLQKAK